MLSSTQFLTILAAVSALAAPDHLRSRRLDVLNARLWRRDVFEDRLHNLTFVHVNDVHAHLDQYRKSGTDCDPPSPDCVGGYSRIKTKVEEIRSTTPNTLLLNMGDEFQGTLFYSFYGGSKIAETVNDLNFDAMTIGNHEFDGGDDQLASYLHNVTAPVVSANIKTNNHWLSSRIKPYHVFPEHSLAVIGLTTIHTKTTSSPGRDTEFLDPVEALQRTVDEINAKENVGRIIAMTHIGYEDDVDLARRTRGVHLILGGHSHTLLGDFDEAEGPYPTIQRNLDGEEVFIVTAWRWGQVLGFINIAFENGPGGRVLEYTGGPIVMDSSIPRDTELQAKVDAWRKPFDEYSKKVVGWTNGDLDQTRCQIEECTLGNLITDAMLDYRLDAGGKVHGAIMNAGGIRATIPQGNVTRGAIVTSFPFGNAVVDLEFSGRELWDMFEGIVSRRNSANKEVTSFVQVSRGVAFSYNPSVAAGSRLRSLNLTSDIKITPDDQNRYVVTTIDFVAAGGDGFLNPPRKPGPPLNTLDDVLADYIRAKSPYTPFKEGRITKLEGYRGSGQDILKTCIGLRCRSLPA
ncbi:5'-nucleotidase [Cantharellus anzutake]|uniref:5'-nucleotidase n=1 Tax=Cantharellus anzutake TaxID=1750568 RepID=UPI0019083265|nr:5'-nucleotidase [Cantharellus anzutake]KAF8335741.1 5'-nucleotidase [Cantharellus anzutake]